MNKLKEVTIGTDAEVFFKDEDNFVASVIGIIGGTKEDPRPIGKDCFVQEDNILAEFNIPPVTTLSAFVDNINYCKEWLEVNYPEYSLHFASSEKIERYLLLDGESQVFGCAPDCIVDFRPDRDEQTDDEKECSLIEKTSSNIRTSGFHIHIGYKDSTIETNRELVKLFEKYVTLHLLDSDVDVFNRRLMYGKAGSYRNKPYGVECRSLGGYFLKDNATITTVWERLQLALGAFNSGERVSRDEFSEIKFKINNKQTKTKEVCAE